MSFPQIHFGVPGDEKVTAASAIGGLPLGARLFLDDGRIFAHARADTATAIVTGCLYVQQALVEHGPAGSGFVTAGSASQTIAVGSKSIILTCGNTAVVTANQYADGFMTIQTGTGMGHTHKVKENTVATTGAAFTVTLYDKDPIAATIAVGTTVVSLRTNPFSGILLRAAASSSVGVPSGVSV